MYSETWEKKSWQLEVQINYTFACPPQRLSLLRSKTHTSTAINRYLWYAMVLFIVTWEWLYSLAREVLNWTTFSSWSGWTWPRLLPGKARYVSNESPLEAWQKTCRFIRNVWYMKSAGTHRNYTDIMPYPTPFVYQKCCNMMKPGSVPFFGENDPFLTTPPPIHFPLAVDNHLHYFNPLKKTMLSPLLFILTPF